jgi:hypothetical protein
MSARNPEIIAGHVALGEAVSRIDQLETRTWNDGHRGIYLAADLPPNDAQRIAENVVLTLAYIAIGRVT